MLMSTLIKVRSMICVSSVFLVGFHVIHIIDSHGFNAFFAHFLHHLNSFQRLIVRKICVLILFLSHSLPTHCVCVCFVFVFGVSRAKFVGSLI